MWAKCLRSLLALVAVFAWALALMVGPGSGTAFALTVAPPAPPPVSTIGTVTTATDTVAVVADGTAAADGAIAATGICAAATLGTCAAAAVVAAGVGYGVYKLIKWGWGGHHVAPSPIITSNDNWGNGITVTAHSVGVNPSVTVTYPAGSWNFTVWGYQSNGSFNGNCGGCVGVRSYAAGTSTFTGNSCSGCTGVALVNGTSQCLAYYGSPDCHTFMQTTYGTNVANPSIGSTSTTTSYAAGTNNPQQIKLDVACLDGSGGTSHAVSTSAVFYPADSSIPDTTAVPCPNGTTPKDATVTEHDNTNNTDTTVETVTAPALSPSNPCSTAGAGCRPMWQVKDSTGTYHDFAPDTGQTYADAPDPKRCEWENPTVTPETDGGALPASDCAAVYPTPTTAPSDESCVPSGLAAWDPLEWVYKPVKCVLQWAFVPTDAQVEADISPLQSAWNSSPPGVVVSGIGTLFAPLLSMPTGSGDCDGPDVNVDLPGWQPGGGASGTTAAPAVSGGTTRNLDIHPFSMCNPVGLWVHNWVMPFVTALVYIAGFYAVARTFMRVVGYDAPIDGSLGSEVSA